MFNKKEFISKRELLEIFPEAKSYLLDRKERYEGYLEIMMRRVKEQLTQADRYRDEFTKWFAIELIGIQDGDLLNHCQREIKKIDNYFVKNISGRITSVDIERAREYPFKDLIEVKRDFAICPFHSEKKGSFYVKNNWGYCYGCGWHGDTIKFIQEIRGCGFIEAVKMLN